MSCIKCKAQTGRNLLCARHIYCTNCVVSLKACQYCQIVSACSNCPNKSKAPLGVIGECEHKLCADCMTEISVSKRSTCPLCSKPISFPKMEAYLKYLAKNVKLEYLQCKGCGKKGQFKAKEEYYNCKHCGLLQCLKHQKPMKMCLCKCPDCLRQTKFDYSGRPLDCRCITSETHIRERSPSPYRPVSNRDAIKLNNYPPYQGAAYNQRENDKSPLRPIGQLNYKEVALSKRENKQDRHEVMNVQKRQPNGINEYQIYPQMPVKPMSANRPLTPRDISSMRQVTTTPLVSTRPSQPYLLTQPTVFPEQKPQKEQVQGLQAVQQTPPQLKQKVTFQITAQRWKCKECECLLYSKVPKELICGYCSILSMLQPT